MFLQRLTGYIVRGFARSVLFLAFRPKVMWTDPSVKELLRTRPCIVVSNHVRGIDGAVIQTMLRGVRCHSLVASDMLEHMPVTRWAMPYLRLLSIDRQHASMAWLRSSRQVLKDGDSIYICPEGKCHFDKQVGEFHPGFALLAAMADVPVIPICHNGMYQPVFGHRFRMIIGAPVQLPTGPNATDHDILEQSAETVRQQVITLQRQLNG